MKKEKELTHEEKIANLNSAASRAEKLDKQIKPLENEFLSLALGAGTIAGSDGKRRGKFAEIAVAATKLLKLKEQLEPLHKAMDDTIEQEMSLRQELGVPKV